MEDIEAVERDDGCVEPVEGEDGGVEPAAGEDGGVEPVEGEDGGVEPAAGEDGGVEQAEGEDGGVEQAEGEDGGVEPAEGEEGNGVEEVILGGSRWRRNGCRVVLLLAFRNGSNVFVMCCSKLKKKKIKQENKQLQVRWGTNKKVVYKADGVVALPQQISSY